MNWGCYDLDYLLSLLDWTLVPKLALAARWQVAPHLSYHAAEGSDAETHVCALIRCEGGTVISYERAEAATAAAEDAWRIVGSKGSLRLRMQPAEGKQIIYDTANAEEGLVSRVIWEGEEPWGSMSECLAADFARAVREGRQPATDLDKALVMQKITDAIYASADSGQPVEIT